MMAYAGKNKKAIEPVVLDMRETSGIAQYFVILSGSSSTQVNAIMQEVSRVCHESEIPVAHIEGAKASSWILIDLDDVIVHVFSESERRYYNLEKLWKQAKRVSVPKL